MRLPVVGACAVALAWAPAANAQSSDADGLRAELSATRAELARQEERLRRLEARLNGLASAAPAMTAGPIVRGETPVVTASSNGSATVPVEPVAVGAAPDDFDRAPAIAVLGDMGNVITRRGQLTLEPQLEYARADRNRALFRGIELVESVLVGVFDINESRQDVLTASLTGRYGLTDRLEFGVRVPFVYRNDASVLAPIQGSTNNDAAGTIDNSASGKGLGDVEFSVRYQLTNARGGRPFLIGNLQVVAPTGSNPFDVSRDDSGRQLRAATGAGFWGVSPSLTAILPSDPAVLFGTLGYTRNFGADVDTEIPPVRIVYVKPGDSISASAGIGLALNQRTSLNIGYAHTWAFGTTTRSLLIDPGTTAPEINNQRARDLQIGRLLFGVTYRVSDRASINWTVEAGATDDATDLRTVLRIPFVALTGG